MALKRIMRGDNVRETKDKLDISVPSLSKSDYVALIKSHYIELASKLVLGRDNVPEPSQELRVLEEFAMFTGIRTYIEDKLPVTRDDIDFIFRNYESEIMPKMEEMQEYYGYDFRNIAFDIISVKWSDEQKQLFSEGYLPEFRKFLHKDIGKFEALHDYGDFQPRGYGLTDNPKGNLAFRISKDGFILPVNIRCELVAQNPEKFKKVGYYGYCDPFDTYKLKSFSVTGPLGVSWDDKLTMQDKRDVFEFSQNAIKKLGVIHLNCGREIAVDQLFPGTKRTIENSKKTQLAL